MAHLSLINGRPSDCLPVNDRGLAYGDGLFETIAVHNAQPQLLQFHLRRLQTSCIRLSLSLDVSLLVSEIEQLMGRVDSAQPYVLKIIITREAGGRGYAYKPELSSQRILQLMPLNMDSSLIQEAGVRVKYCETPLSINPVLAGMKHLCRIENVLARAEWSDESIFEGLMKDTDGFVTEGVMSNFFLVKDAVLYTPHLDRCGVAGVMREFILSNVAPALQLPTALDRLTVEQVNSADELFICNSVIGVVPVTCLGILHKLVGPITKQLQSAVASQLHG